MKLHCTAVVIAAALAALGVSTGAQPGPLTQRIAAFADSASPQWVAIRRDLHQNPELSGQESRTAAIVADWLKTNRLEVRTGVGGHGVVGILTGGRPGPLVAYRADMDAVRSNAPDPVPFASKVPGVRHICGHDMHVAIAMGLVATLAHFRDELPGRVMFIFQPAEESATGANAMLKAGLFAKEKPAAIFGLHAAPLEVGRLTSKPGLMMHPNQIAPGVTNHDALFASSKAHLIAALGAAAFVDLNAPPQGFSEDFGAFQSQVPGVFYFLGMGNAAKGIAAMPHSPGFVADEDAIAFGVKAMAAVVVGRLNEGR